MKFSLLFAAVASVAAFQVQVSPAPRLAPRVAVRPRFGRITCGWGPEPVWSTLKVGSIGDAASGLKSITIAPADGVAAGYTAAGQYVQIREPGAEKASFFAIASAPSAAQTGAPFEFLIKEQPPSDWSPGNAWLVNAAAGAPLEMSQVMGAGFATAENLDGGAYDGFAANNLLLFAAGSGIAPLRAAIEDEASPLGAGGRAVQLYYGVQTPAQMAYAEKFDSWERDYGVTVTPVVSQPEGTGWTGATGYVQDVAKADDAFQRPRNSAVLMCGMKGMAEGVKELAAASGVFEGRVLTNF